MSTAPSLYLDTPVSRTRVQHHEISQREPRTLADLLHDGLYLLFLLRNGYEPLDSEAFAGMVDQFFGQFERNAKKMGIGFDDVSDAKYAFCALLDEAILASNSAIRPAWEIRPLQLRYFGDHLAGENFFSKLEQLRNQGASRIQALEVFYLCLLLGFEGKYVFEGSEKLNYLVTRLGEEIQHLKGQQQEFAPHWRAPDEIRNIIRHEVPLWVYVALLGIIGLSCFLTLNWLLGRSAYQELAPYNNVIQPYTGTASITITLP